MMSEEMESEVLSAFKAELKHLVKQTEFIDAP